MRRNLRFTRSLAAMLLLGLTSLRATVTINFEGGILYGTDTSSPLADSALIYAVARPAGTSFSGPTAASFTGTDEILLGKWTPDSEGMGAAGAFSAALTSLSLTGGLVAGMDVWLVWFPDLTLASLSPSPGMVYGAYHDAEWVIPNDGSIVPFWPSTLAIGGSLPEDTFIASRQISAIPELSTLAALLGMSAFVVVFWRRRKEVLRQRLQIL